jgi:hypothetical protein
MRQHVFAAMIAVMIAGMITASPVFAADPEEDRASAPHESTRPILLGLYASASFLQGYDAYSTLKALGTGAHETNPLMKTLTANPTVFVGVKAGLTGISILVAERMWRNHNRTGAIVAMAASNGVMAIVAANNARVLAQSRR